MFDLNHYVISKRVNLISINKMDDYFLRGNHKILWKILSHLPAGKYTIIDLERVLPEDFARYATAAYDFLTSRGCLNSNIVLMCFYESFANVYTSLAVHTLALKGVNHILFLDNGDTLDSLPEAAHDNFKLTHLTTPYYFKMYFLKELQPEIDLGRRSNLFCSLARLPRYERFKFTNLLLKNPELASKGLISCGWGDYDFEKSQWKYLDNLFRKYIDEDLMDRYPVTLADSVDEEQHNIPLNILDCCINVVLEGECGVNPTSYNRRIGLNITSVPSDRHLFSEKTAKAVAARQLPLFIAAPGYVHYLRQLGFDVFDDFFDHSYDKVDDLDLRIQLVYEQLEEKSRLGLTYINNFMDVNQKRLYRNIDVMRVLGEDLEARILQYITANFC